MVKIIEIPIDLVEEVLKGIYVQDIINIGQTCRYLRFIVTGSKYAFRDACNLDMVALPEEKFIRSFSSWEMHSSAIRSKIIAERIRDVYTPLHPLIHTICKMTPGSDEPLSVTHITEHLCIFRSKQDGWHLMDTSGPTGVSVALTGSRGIVSKQPCVQIPKDQGAMYFAFISTVDHITQDLSPLVIHLPNIYILKVSIAKETFGLSELLATIYLPEIVRRSDDDPILIMRDNIVACYTKRELLLCDWKKSTATMLRFSDEANDVYNIQEDGVLFHPKREGIVVQLVNGDNQPQPAGYRTFCGFMDIDIPFSMSPLNPFRKTQQSTWDDRLCPISYVFDIHSIPEFSAIPSPQFFVTCTSVREFGGDRVMDVTIFSRSDEPEYSGTISLSTWKLIAPLEIPYAWPTGGPPHKTLACIATAGSSGPHLVHITNNEKVDRMQMLLGPDDGAYGSCWITLDAQVLEKYVRKEEHGRGWSYLKPRLPNTFSFDVRRGRLLAFIGENLHTIQY
ncbi:hypothetical protein SISSUDRAFT_1119639 [Sistotremastrum suecicum HHB10207 ss-3]|uniref:F-box domain-containing protein n=1 Tax=Sistotremastrum suecicum HHB10207 ss-3 TaxID=1314776 RepID=A0A166DF17_9AGAM|nr:hypothetical protein SISSUDRAFT_1119639 [Sistotremastrum suecicum HHB10207 ss-3]